MSYENRILLSIENTHRKLLLCVPNINCFRKTSAYRQQCLLVAHILVVVAAKKASSLLVVVFIIVWTVLRHLPVTCNGIDILLKNIKILG